MKNTATIVVDYQNTFIPESDGGTGELGVNGAGALAPYINIIVNETRKKGGLVINTLDSHNIGHMSLASSYKGKRSITEAFAAGINPNPQEHPEYFLTQEEVQNWDEQNNLVNNDHTLDIEVLESYIKTIGVQALWPDHAIAGEENSELFSQYDSQETDINIYKGESLEQDSYSGFGGKTHSESESRSLNQVLEEYQIQLVNVVGLATDYCVGATAEDSLKNGYKTQIHTRGIAGVDSKGAEEVLKKLKDQGTKIID